MVKILTTEYKFLYRHRGQKSYFFKNYDFQLLILRGILEIGNGMKNQSTTPEASIPLLVKAMDARKIMGNISTTKFNQLVKPLLNPIAVSPILIFYKYTDLKTACDILEERYGRSPTEKGVGLWEGDRMKDSGLQSEKVRSIFRSPGPSSATRLEEALERHLGKKRK